MDLSPADIAALAQQAGRLTAAVRYLVLATADATGRPWATPVYFTPDGPDRYLWVSSPDARHSRNIAERPEVGLVVFDSTVPVGAAEATYAEARARLVAHEDLERSAAAFGRPDDHVAFTVDELRGAEPLRMYEALAAETSVLLRGGDPRNLGGIDTRIVIPPGP